MNIFSNIKIGTKLILGFGLVALLTVGIGAFSSIKMLEIKEASLLLSQQNMPAISNAIDIEKSVRLTMYNARGYTYTEDKSFLDSSLQQIEKTKKNLKAARDHAEKFNLSKRLELINKAEKDFLEYEELLNKTIKANESIAAEKQKMMDHAEKFLKSAEEFIASQDKQLDEEIKQLASQGIPEDKVKQRASKIRMANEIVDTGNSIVTTVWTAIASRNPELFKKAYKSFDEIFSRLDKLKGITIRAEDLADIQGTREAADFYKKDMEAFLNFWLEREELNKKRGEIAGLALEAVEGISDFSSKKTVEAAEKSVETASFTSKALIMSSFICLILSVVLGLVISRNIAIPLKRVSVHLQDMAKGNFSQILSGEDTTRGDEIGDVGRSGNDLTKSMKTIIAEISHGVQTVASSSTELSAVSSQMTSNARNMSDKTSAVAAASEESSSTAAAVAGLMDSSTTNLNSVACATEEMTATISEVASNTEKARSISRDASSQAKQASEIMKVLGQAANEIGKVTEAISDISDQTNLLALNATIEAARAGEYGKGFAVVANEIKELARQTAEATSDIKNRISGIQTSSTNAIGNIEKVTGVITEVEFIVSNIAAAIEEQAAVTKDLAGSISTVTSEIMDSNDRVAQTATVAQSIAEDIAIVNGGLSEIAAGGVQVQSSADELSRLSEKLKMLMGQFIIDEEIITKSVKENKKCKKAAQNKTITISGSNEMVPVYISNRD